MKKPLPERIANSPTLFLGLELYWLAFHELNSCRPYGWSVGPIPFTAIQDYAQAYEFSEEQTETLMHHIRVMDKTYLDYNQRKQDAQRKKK